MSDGLVLDLTAEERRAVRYCTYCPKMCRFACPVAHGEARETVTPWGLMRLLNLLDQGTVEADETALEVLNHCVSCGRCTAFCLHDNPVAETLQHGRAQLLARGLSVPSDWAVAAGGCGEAPPPAFHPDATDRPAFLPACDHTRSPEAARLLVEQLEALEGAGVPLSIPDVEHDYGCGFHEWEVGLSDAAADSWARFAELGGGRPAVVTDCAASLWALGRPGSTGAPAVRHVVEWLADALERLRPGNLDARVVVHDACMTGRRLGLDAATRAVVGHLTGAPPGELHEHGKEARCCGAVGRWADVRPDAQARAAGTVVADIADSRADLVVTASPTCRRALAAGVAAAELCGPGGRPVRVVDILELVELVSHG